MKTFIKLSLIILSSIVISSCAALRPPDMSKISVGMDKQTVINTLGKKPEKVVGAKSYPNGVVEVLQYTTGMYYRDNNMNTANGRPEYTWLYFFNNKLVQYGHPDNDWQYNADNISAMQAAK